MLSKNLLTEINRKSELLNSLKPLSPENQAKLDRKFRLEFNFNSNHLEGNTLTYGETELLLIFDQTEGTHDYREYQEMQAHDVALKMVQEEAADHERPLMQRFIKDLNEKILVKPFWKDAETQDGQPTRKQIVPGEYKKTPNSVRLSNGEIFSYSAPGDVEKEMAELVSWYNAQSETENPIYLAAILHYRFVRIHPFDDGNGRTARLLMNYVLSKHQLPLIVIKSAEKKDYLTALNHADAGDLNAFSEYIGQQLLWSLDLSIKAAKGESIDEDDDLDKELELLKQELKQIPDEYDKKKTKIEIAEVLSKSIVPLYYRLNKNLSKIQDLFVEIDNFIMISDVNLNGVHHRKFNEKSIEKLFHQEFIFSPFEKYDVIKIELSIKCTALKKIVQQLDINYTLDVSLDDYHYNINDDMQRKSLIRLPYGRFLTERQIDNLVRPIINSIIIDIREATNLNN